MIRTHFPEKSLSFRIISLAEFRCSSNCKFSQSEEPYFSPVRLAALCYFYLCSLCDVKQKRFFYQIPYKEIICRGRYFHIQLLLYTCKATIGCGSSSLQICVGKEPTPFPVPFFAAPK